jgi:hypothetical protein
MVRRYIRNTKRLVKNTIIILILGIILIAAYYLLGLPQISPLLYYASMIVIVIFGLHLWLIVISLHLNHRK